MGLKDLVEASRRYGANPDFVLAGGGNTSYKEDDLLYIKASGTTLAEMTEAGLVRMNRPRLDAIWRKSYAQDSDERERQALADLMAARIAEEAKRPSVETLLHELLRQRYVVHLHPALVNGLTCARDGEATARKLFPQKMIWIPVVNPGYVLAKHIRDAIAAHLASGGDYPDLLFLQNHGVFVAADSIEEIDRIYAEIISRLSERLERTPDLTPSSAAKPVLRRAAQTLAQALAKRELVADAAWELLDNPEVAQRVVSQEAFMPLRSFGYTPDHLVYCKAAPLWLPAAGAVDAGEPGNGGSAAGPGSAWNARDAGSAAAVERALDEFVSAHGVAPRIAAVEGAGAIAIGEPGSVVTNAAALFLDLLKIVAYAESFGGPQPMPSDKIAFILNWEVESYRAKVSGRET